MCSPQRPVLSVCSPKRPLIKKINREPRSEPATDLDPQPTSVERTSAMRRPVPSTNSESERRDAVVPLCWMPESVEDDQQQVDLVLTESDLEDPLETFRANPRHDEAGRAPAARGKAGAAARRRRGPWQASPAGQERIATSLTPPERDEDDIHFYARFHVAKVAKDLRRRGAPVTVQHYSPQRRQQSTYSPVPFKQFQKALLVEDAARQGGQRSKARPGLQSRLPKRVLDELLQALEGVRFEEQLREQSLLQMLRAYKLEPSGVADPAHLAAELKELHARLEEFALSAMMIHKYEEKAAKTEFFRKNKAILEMQAQLVDEEFQ